MNKFIRSLIFGRDISMVSSNEREQIMLAVQYALIALVVLVAYTVIEISNGSAVSFPLYAIGFAVISATLVLHRFQYHQLSYFILFTTINIVVYLVASSESISTGACIFFVPVALGSSAIFNYAKRKIALGFGVLSFLLCLLALTGFSILPYRIYSDDEMQLSFIINFFVAFPVSMMAVYLLIRMSHYSATQLVDSNQQMKKLNEELDRFVYSTSHDLRAPLLSLLGLLKLAETATPAEATLYHGMMHSRVQNLDKFIKDITDYSRNNRLLVEKESIQPACLLNEIWESLRYSEDAQGIKFINDIQEDQVLISDNARLRVVLSNLVANAIRYHDHKKEDKFIRVSFHTTATALVIRIEDNGQGIAKDLQVKVFEMFFRGNETSQGSGLGLYIVKETLAKLSASISLTSTPREGSTFSISIPV